ncbi:MAG: hypothetical protein Q8R79_05300 [Legionellaceae bacterium]|nr:hypothetical protein [Legionellaceae bacterium]
MAVVKALEALFNTIKSLFSKNTKENITLTSQKRGFFAPESSYLVEEIKDLLKNNQPPNS